MIYKLLMNFHLFGSHNLPCVFSHMNLCSMTVLQAHAVVGCLAGEAFYLSVCVYSACQLKVVFVL